MVHQEDAGLNVEMAKLAFAKGIWSYVCKMDDALRQYKAVDHHSQLTSGVTAVTLIQKVGAMLLLKFLIVGLPLFFLLGNGKLSKIDDKRHKSGSDRNRSIFLLEVIFSLCTLMASLPPS